MGCINGTVDDSTYSSPVPVIGVYIAGASLACLIMMVYDVIVYGLLARKRWLPCRRFKLDSVTLTLLGVAAKLPVDLTTPMPRREDQLSKLTGTAFICVCIGFLVPSLGVTNESECFTNMVALTIFVIIVAVNICIQLGTGVIVLFFEENIIILVLMLLLLLTLWQIYFYIKSQNRLTTDERHNLITKGNESMFERLKLSYVYAYCSNPQFKISMHPMNAAVSIICLICSAVIAQATIRSLILKQLYFCEGKSDYDWSMLLIVITQVVTVILGTLAIVFRWLALFSRMMIESIFVSFRDDDSVIQRKRLSLHNLHKLFTSVNNIIQLVIVSPAWLVRKLLRVYKQDDLEYFSGVIAAGKYIVRKSDDDIVNLRDVCNTEPLNHLKRVFLSRNRLHDYPGVCSLSVAFLVKVAQVCIPNDRLQSLLQAYEEANEILHFIDKTIQPKSSDNNNKLSYAKAVASGAEFTCLLPYVGQPPGGVATITALKDTFRTNQISGSGKIWPQLAAVVDHIDHEGLCRTIVDLKNNIEQLFVDMLHTSFRQLPIAIFKNLSESPDEEFEERVRVAMEFHFKTRCLETVQWSFPAESNISSYIA